MRVELFGADQQNPKSLLRSEGADQFADSGEKGSLQRLAEG
jgi:hypothetical protein